jgi:hypothetical protein
VRSTAALRVGGKRLLDGQRRGGRGGLAYGVNACLDLGQQLAGSDPGHVQRELSDLPERDANRPHVGPSAALTGP